MPEGPEVKTIAKTLADSLVGLRLGAPWVSGKRLRRPLSAARLASLSGARIEGVGSYGKFLFLETDLSSESVLLAQFGMTGALTVSKIHDALKPHTHLRWPLLKEPLEIRYTDIRRFGFIDVCDQKSKQEIMLKLGPDPFSWEKGIFSGLARRLKSSSRSIKDVLLDQSMIAGIGNIYASESLFLAGISPLRLANEISLKEYVKLFESVEHVMKQSLGNFGTTFSNYVDGQGQKGRNLSHLWVFQLDGKPCKKCSFEITRIRQGGRSTFYCAKCQR